MNNHQDIKLVVAVDCEVIELTDEQLLEVAGGRMCGAGNGGKVGEVPVVTG